MKILFLLLLTLVSCFRLEANGLIPFAYTVYSSHHDLGFIAKGRLVVVEFSDEGQNPFGRLLIYSVDGATPLIVDGTLASMEKVVRSGFPDGLTDTFLRERLAAALLAMTSSGRSYLLDQKMIGGLATLKLDGESERDMRATLKIVFPPRVKSNDNNWELKYNYFSSEGRVYEVAYSGEAHPFTIREAATKTIDARIPPGVLTGEGQVYEKEK